MDTLRDHISLQLYLYLIKYTISDDRGYQEREQNVYNGKQQIDKIKEDIILTTRKQILFHTIRGILMAIIPFEMLVFQLYCNNSANIFINYICAAIVQLICYNILIIFSAKYEQQPSKGINEYFNCHSYSTKQHKYYLIANVAIQFLLFAFPIIAHYTQQKMDIFAIWQFIWGIVAGINSNFDNIMSYLAKIKQQNEQELIQQKETHNRTIQENKDTYEKTKECHNNLKWLFCNYTAEKYPISINIHQTLFKNNADFISLVQKQRLVGYHHYSTWQQHHYEALISEEIFKINKYNRYEICRDQRDGIGANFWKVLEQSQSIENNIQNEYFYLQRFDICGLRLKQQIQVNVILHTQYSIQATHINIKYMIQDKYNNRQQYDQDQEDIFNASCQTQHDAAKEKENQLIVFIDKQFTDWHEFGLGWVDQCNPCQDDELQKLWRDGQVNKIETNEYQQECINNVINKIKRLQHNSVNQSNYPPKVSQLQQCVYYT